MNSQAAIDVSALPKGEFGPRATLWWGVALMIMIESAMFGTLAAAYFYLRLNFAEWPPHGTPLPDLGFPTLTLMLLLASVFPIYLTDVYAKSGDNDWAMIVWMWIGIVMGAVILGSRWIEFNSLHTRWDENAYGSIVWFIIGVHTGHVLASTVETLVLAIVLLRHPIDRKHRLDVHVDSVYWYFVVASWMFFYVLIYWSPRWL
jgi:cytochrome c oxidase subunit III